MPFFTLKPILFVSLACTAAAQIQTPQPGLLRSPGSPVYKIYGVAGNLIYGPPVFGSAEALSFVDEGGMLVTGNQFQLVKADGTVVVSAPYATSSSLVSAGTQLNSAAAWTPERKLLTWWDGSSLHRLTVDDPTLAGPVTSLRLEPNGTAAVFLVSQPDNSVLSVRFALPGGLMQSAELLPGVKAPAYQVDSTLIWSDEAGLEISSRNGTRQTLPLHADGPLLAERMSNDWVHLSFPAGAETHYALHLSGTKPSLSQLPAPPASKTLPRGAAR